MLSFILTSGRSITDGKYCHWPEIQLAGICFYLVDMLLLVNVSWTATVLNASKCFQLSLSPTRTPSIDESVLLWIQQSGQGSVCGRCARMLATVGHLPVRDSSATFGLLPALQAL